MPLLIMTRRNCKRGWLNYQEALLCLRYISYLISDNCIICEGLFVVCRFFCKYIRLGLGIDVSPCNFRSEEQVKSK